MPPSRLGVAFRRTSRSHAAPPYGDDDPSRFRCRDAGHGEEEEEEAAAERRRGGEAEGVGEEVGERQMGQLLVL
jgi:hypothetical protein